MKLRENCREQKKGIPIVSGALLDCGYSDKDVGKVMGGKFFHLWKEVVPKQE